MVKKFLNNPVGKVAFALLPVVCTAILYKIGAFSVDIDFLSPLKLFLVCAWLLIIQEIIYVVVSIALYKARWIGIYQFLFSLLIATLMFFYIIRTPILEDLP